MNNFHDYYDIYFKILMELDISQEQFFILYSFIFSREDLLRKYATKYPPEPNNLIGGIHFENLLLREDIKLIPNTSGNYSKDYMISRKVIDVFIKYNILTKK